MICVLTQNKNKAEQTKKSKSHESLCGIKTTNGLKNKWKKKNFSSTLMDTDLMDCFVKQQIYMWSLGEWKLERIWFQGSSSYQTSFEKSVSKSVTNW